MSGTARVVAIERAPFERGDHVEVGERLVARLRSEAPATFTDGRFYQYAPTRGVFEIVEPSKLSQIVQGFAGLPIKHQKKVLLLRANDVGGALKLGSDRASDPGFFQQAVPGVAFADRFVEVTNERIVQKEHAPDHRARFAYAFPFAPMARPAKLLEFFGQVFRDDADAEQKIDLLQEYLGASLLGLATKFQRALVLLGDGANGKSVITRIAEACMPPGSVCAIPPQDVGQEYRRAQLAGKLLNVVSELPEADILDSESWKSVVSGDTMTGREIRQAPFTFRAVAGHIAAANRLPGTSDQTHGFWRRHLVMTYGRIFAEHEQNPNLADQILRAETPAIVSWILYGAQRVLVQGTYTIPESSAKALIRWRGQADQVRAFADEWTERLPLEGPASDGTPAEQLYKSYRTWAAENGHKPVASNTFGERMRLLGLESKSDGRLRRYPVKLSRKWDAE